MYRPILLHATTPTKFPINMQPWQYERSEQSSKLPSISSREQDHCTGALRHHSQHILHGVQNTVQHLETLNVESCEQNISSEIAQTTHEINFRPSSTWEHLRSLTIEHYTRCVWIHMKNSLREKDCKLSVSIAGDNLRSNNKTPYKRKVGDLFILANIMVMIDKSYFV